MRPTDSIAARGKAYAVSPPARRMADMITALKERERAEISSCRWYVAAYEGRVATNPQMFAKLRPKRRA